MAKDFSVIHFGKVDEISRHFADDSEALAFLRTSVGTAPCYITETIGGGSVRLRSDIMDADTAISAAWGELEGRRPHGVIEFCRPIVEPVWGESASETICYIKRISTSVQGWRWKIVSYVAVEAQ